MTEIVQSEIFRKWLNGLKDRQARARILDRLLRMQYGNPGDVRPVGGGVSEARIHYGAGYRLYFIRRGDTVIVMLAGGDKRSQSKDIRRAKTMAKEWRQQ